MVVSKENPHTLKFCSAKQEKKNKQLPRDFFLFSSVYFKMRKLGEQIEMSMNRDFLLL